MTLYPWKHDLWDKVSGMRSRMPHAVLLHGRAGIGKLEFARGLAAALLCDQPAADNRACGACQSCNLLVQGNHPDFRLLEPEEAAAAAEAEEGAPATKSAKKSQISVDQVRELSEFIGLSSHRAGLRIVLLQPAEALNQASANALLKMLEEPPAGVIFILVTNQPQRLLPTIRSRCSKIDMPMPSQAIAESWLAAQGLTAAADLLSYSGGAPLIIGAADDAEVRLRNELRQLLSQGGRIDAMHTAAMLVRAGILDSIDLLQKWVYDLLAVRLAGKPRYHPASVKSLQGLAETVDLPLLLEYQHKLNESRRFAQHPLNAELQLEGLMFQYSQLFTMASKT